MQIQDPVISVYEHFVAILENKYLEHFNIEIEFLEFIFELCRPY